MVFAIIGQYTVAVHTRKPPSDEEWAEYLTAHAPLIEKGVSMRVLIVTEGGAPTAVQRMKMNEMVAEWIKVNPDCVRSAIITSSAFVRGVVTAISWFRPIARAFSHDHMDQAFSYLEIPPKYIPEIEQMIPVLKSKLGTDAAPRQYLA
jgi:hypothetical protein